MKGEVKVILSYILATLTIGVTHKYWLISNSTKLNVEKLLFISLFAFLVFYVLFSVFKKDKKEIPQIAAKQQTNVQRDDAIDIIRGCTMIWVIVVHSIYWTGLFKNAQILRSFLLIEMPLFFFVIGATTRLSKYVNYKNFIAKRFCSIVIPYWIYGFVASIFCAFKNHDFLNAFLSWLIPIGNQICPQPFLRWAVWFIPVYLISVFLTPPLLVACN